MGVPNTIRISQMAICAIDNKSTLVPLLRVPTNPKQEFRELVMLTGWNQARVARELCMTPSAVSQVFRTNSKVKPSATTLCLLRLLLGIKANGESHCVQAPNSRLVEGWETNLIGRLRSIPKKRRQRLLRIFAAIIVADSP